MLYLEHLCVKVVDFPFRRFSSSFPVKIIVLFAAVIALIIVFQVSVAEFSHIYAFGDSLSDIGNAFAKTGIPPAPYFEGRF